jgi:hypothetical protein
MEIKSRILDYIIYMLFAYFIFAFGVFCIRSLQVGEDRMNRLQSEARPLEIKYLMGEKLTKDEAERLVRIHEEIGRMRRR